jgi:hypothetical protein
MLKLIRLSFYAVMAALSAVSLAFALKAIYDDIDPSSSKLFVHAKEACSKTLKDAGERLAS